MPPTMLVAFRVPKATADRLDALATALSTPWHEMKRSEVARAVLERGLEALEQEATKRDENESLRASEPPEGEPDRRDGSGTPGCTEPPAGAPGT